MRSMRKMTWLFALVAALGIMTGLSLVVVPTAHAQATISTGGIEGTIVDPKGGTVSGAKITVTSKETGQKYKPELTSSGSFNTSALTPGVYVLRVEAPGFKTIEKTLVVQVGLITAGDLTLELGESSTIITVEGSSVQVNTDQATVSGVLTTQQIENLPINGRNFLDLAQLEPGVQIQDGSNFDPTKTGFSSISFGGRFGRTARIEVDGVDVSDETVGTTTTAIPSSALQEFQLSQSSLDITNELTSSGSVNVVTRSGTNSLHGQAFGLFRDSTEGALLQHPAGIPAPYQRSQFGGNFGGPILKDKLFFFMDAERTKQELFNPVVLSAPFDVLGSGYSTPYRETDLLGKVDYVVTQNLKLFYRFTYFENAAIAPSAFQPFKNKDYTRTHALGGDWTTGAWTHSVRFEYLKFQNQIVDASAGLGLPLGGLGVGVNVPSPNASFGPNLLAPQTTPQSDHQLKYDGSRILGKHIIRYGVAFNHLQGGGFAKFFSLGPQITTGLDTNALAFAATNPFGPGGTSNPLNYPVEQIIMGNGLGFGTELKSFGFPAGGLGPDNRLAFYGGDSWKFKSNLTITAGLRWARDTGRTDSDIAALPAVNAAYPGLGNQVRQPNKNFSPELGVAWDPFKSGKTVVRAGIGIYYENVIWNNVLFDRPLRIPSGAFFGDGVPCVGVNSTNSVPFADGTGHNPNPLECGNPANGGFQNAQSIGAAIPFALAFQNQYQQSAATNGLNAPNGSFLPNLIANGAVLPTGFFAPNFQTPRSVQMNVGVQRQIWKGGVLSADFIRNVGTHLSLGQDINHNGDTRFFNKPAAQAAFARTLDACAPGSTLAQDLIACPGLHPAQGGNPAGAVTMADFAHLGLGTPGDAGVGACVPAAFAPGVTPFQCAFGGVNPNVAAFIVQEPIGRSTYDALQVKYVQNVSNPIKGIKNANFQVAYSLSRFENNGGASGAGALGTPASNDLDFVAAALDNANPARYFGPSALDRTNQFSFGGSFDLPFGFRTGIVGHFYSALPTSLDSQNSGLGPGEIYRTDFTGDGTITDPLPGTHLGSFGRGISAGGLNGFLTNFNSNFAGQATPAGQTLISSGIFTLAQLQALNGVIQPIPLAPAGNVPMYGLRAFDFKLSWVHKFKERLTVEPSFSAFNIFNFANFDLPTATGGVLGATLSGQPGSVNGTTYATQSGQRVGAGTGTFGLGAPRVIEWGLKLTF